MGMYLWFVELTGERSQGSILLYIRKSLECTQNWNGVIIMYSREREREREREEKEMMMVVVNRRKCVGFFGLKVNAGRSLFFAPSTYFLLFLVWWGQSSVCVCEYGTLLKRIVKMILWANQGGKILRLLDY